MHSHKEKVELVWPQSPGPFNIEKSIALRDNHRRVSFGQAVSTLALCSDADKPCELANAILKLEGKYLAIPVEFGQLVFAYSCEVYGVDPFRCLLMIWLSPGFSQSESP
jgi:hypothetical protein